MKPVSLNFGSIKDTIYKYSSRNIVNEGEITNFVNLFINEIKKNPILNVQYLIYKNIEQGTFNKEYLAERYLKQNLKLIESFSWENILEENKSFRLKLLNNVHVDSFSKNTDLHESIHVLIKSKLKPDFNDFLSESKAYETVINYLLKTKENNKKEEVIQEFESEEYPKLISWKFITELAVNNFNKRYSHLNENEKSLLKILLSDESYKKNYLEDLKQENLNYIETLLSNKELTEQKEDLNKFKNKIISLKDDLTESNIDESIINLFELNCNLKEHF